MELARAASAIASQASLGLPVALLMGAVSPCVVRVAPATRSHRNVSVQLVLLGSPARKSFSHVPRIATIEVYAWVAHVCVALDGEGVIVTRDISSLVRSLLQSRHRKSVVATLAAELEEGHFKARQTLEVQVHLTMMGVAFLV